MDAIDEYLHGCLGVSKIPLAYVVHDDTAIPAADPVGGYAMRIDELIAQAPIMGTLAGLNNYNAIY